MPKSVFLASFGNIASVSGIEGILLKTADKLLNEESAPKITETAS